MVENHGTLGILCNFGDFEAKTAPVELVDQNVDEVTMLVHFYLGLSLPLTSWD